MDFEKLFKFGIEYFSDYFRVFILTLRKPKLYYLPKSKSINKKSREKIVNPSLFGFVLISALIGTAVGSLARGIEYSFDFPSMIILLICWLAYCSIFHIICKLLGGKGTFIETMSVGLQVLSVVYVISNFAEYIWRVLLAYPSLGSWVTNLNENYFGNEQFISNPTIIYFVIQFVFLTIYIPLAGLDLHDFNKSKKVWVVLLFILVITANVTLFIYIMRTLAYISERLSFY